MIQCISMACVAAITIAGLLVMVRVVTIEQVVNGIMRGFLVVLGFMFVLGIVRKLLAVIVLPGLLLLKNFFIFSGFIALLIVVAAAVTGFVAHRFKKRREGN